MTGFIKNSALAGPGVIGHCYFPTEFDKHHVAYFNLRLTQHLSTINATDPECIS